MSPTTWAEAWIRKARNEGLSVYPHQAAFILDNPIRRALTKPSRVVDSLGLSSDEHVLELGPGPGFFSVEIVRRIPEGRLELFDIQPEMLDKARRRLEQAGFHDAGFTSGNADQGLPFPDSTFDVAFLAAVIGEVPDGHACLSSLHRVLKPGGRLVFAEWFTDSDRPTAQEIRDLAESEGFEFVDASGSRWQDVIHFRKIATR